MVRGEMREMSIDGDECEYTANVDTEENMGEDEMILSVKEERAWTEYYDRICEGHPQNEEIPDLNEFLEMVKPFDENGELNTSEHMMNEALRFETEWGIQKNS